MNQQAVNHAEAVAQLTALLPIHIYRLNELALLLDSTKAQVVLTDLENENGSWRDVLRMLGERYRGATLIVAADVRDASSWEEVIIGGGFDVVLKPFTQRELVSIERRETIPSGQDIQGNGPHVCSGRGEVCVPAKILIVDAEPVVRNVVMNILRKCSHVVKEAESLAIAISLLEAETPDLVITNGTMPDATGEEAIARMREKCPDVRILVIPSAPGNGMKQRTADAGLDFYPKPFRADGLRAKVAAILRRDPADRTN